MAVISPSLSAQVLILLVLQVIASLCLVYLNFRVVSLDATSASVSVRVLIGWLSALCNGFRGCVTFVCRGCALWGVPVGAGRLRFERRHERGHQAAAVCGVGERQSLEGRLCGRGGLSRLVCVSCLASSSVCLAQGHCSWRSIFTSLKGEMGCTAGRHTDGCLRLELASLLQPLHALLVLIKLLPQLR